MIISGNCSCVCLCEREREIKRESVRKSKILKETERSDMTNLERQWGIFLISLFVFFILIFFPGIFPWDNFIQLEVQRGGVE